MNNVMKDIALRLIIFFARERPNLEVFVPIGCTLQLFELFWPFQYQLSP